MIYNWPLMTHIYYVMMFSLRGKKVQLTFDGNNPDVV